MPGDLDYFVVLGAALATNRTKDLPKCYWGMDVVLDEAGTGCRVGMVLHDD